MATKMSRISDYKIIKYCRHCKKRMVFKRGEPQQYYCEECRKKF